MSEIKTLNGHSLADTKAREDIATLTENVTALSEEIGELKGSSGTKEEVISPVYSTAGYVHATNNKITSHATYQISDVIELKAGETISFSASLPDYQYVWVLSKWTADGNTLISGLVKFDSTQEQSVNYTATQPVEYVRITHSTRSDYVSVAAVTITRKTTGVNNQISAIAADVEALRDTVYRQALYACFPFVRVGVIGDSLASGCSNFTNAAGTFTSADRKEYSWGKFMEREHGVEVELFTQGGTSTQTWLTRSTGLAAMQAAEACDCYIIGLGVNDKYALGDDYLGSSADVTVGSEDGNADTFYGNYSKIIAALLAKSPRCKIFCLTMPSAQGEKAITYNVAIRDLVGMYDNAHLIDLENDDFYSGEQFTSTWNGAHSTAPGYKIMAEHLWKRMNEYIMENMSSFTDVQWILEDHT